IRDASPNPVEAPMTSTFFAPSILPFDFTYSIWFFTARAAPSGCAVRQMKPLILGSMIIGYGFVSCPIGKGKYNPLFLVQQCLGMIYRRIGHGSAREHLSDFDNAFRRCKLLEFGLGRIP